MIWRFVYWRHVCWYGWLWQNILNWCDHTRIYMGHDSSVSHVNVGRCCMQIQQIMFHAPSGRALIPFFQSYTTSAILVSIHNSWPPLPLSNLYHRSITQQLINVSIFLSLSLSLSLTHTHTHKFGGYKKNSKNLEFISYAKEKLTNLLENDCVYLI